MESDEQDLDDSEFREEFEDDVNNFIYGLVVNNSVNYLRRVRRLEVLNFKYMDSEFNVMIDYDYQSEDKSDYNTIEMNIELDTISTSVVYLFTSYLDSQSFTQSIDDMLTRQYSDVMTVQNVTGTEATVKEFTAMSNNNEGHGNGNGDGGNDSSGMGKNDIIVIVALLAGLSVVIGAIVFACFQRRKHKFKQGSKKIMSMDDTRSNVSEVEFVEKCKQTKQHDALLKQQKHNARLYYS